MNANVKARYENGVLTPLEPLDLEEGEEVTLSISEPNTLNRQATESEGPEKEQATCEESVGVRLLKMAEKLRESVPPEAWDSLPTDGAKNYKHYLYGSSKEKD
ncbi:MAG: antitoxin family protein [Dehalococcoidia bacterium]|nr:antitoxin family protein [Dehalococcoidia bacterium]